MTHNNDKTNSKKSWRKMAFCYFEEYENIKGSSNNHLIPLISIAVDENTAKKTAYF